MSPTFSSRCRRGSVAPETNNTNGDARGTRAHMYNFLAGLDLACALLVYIIFEVPVVFLTGVNFAIYFTLLACPWCAGEGAFFEKIGVHFDYVAVPAHTLHPDYRRVTATS